MNLFKDFMESIRERVPYARFNGWIGLIIKVLILLAVIYAFFNFTSENAEKLLWFMGWGEN